MWGVISIYLSTVAIQGFQEETDSGWRRGIGGFGSLLSMFILSTTISDPLYQSITWLALGIVAFGFGMLYMQRFGDETEVYVSEEHDKAIEEVAEEEESIPEPVTEVVEEDVPELVVEVVEEETVEDLQPLLKKEIEETIAEEENIPKPVEEVVENNLIETNEGFFFKLSPDILNNVRAALENTDYDGFKPVLEFDSSGQIVLNFE